MIDRDVYLQRIGYAGAADSTVETLASLSRAHLLTVPFENLDIVRGREILLDPARVYEKVVTGRRGGFCYELNGMFALLLRDLGYEVDLLAMQFTEAEGYGPERDHLTLLVRVPGTDDRWLVDVGGGRHSFVTPIVLGDPAEQPHRHDGAVHRIDPGAADFWHLWRKELDGDWQELYRFTLQPYQWQDFAPMCRHHQTSPESPFTQGQWCTKLTPSGRITLRDGLLTITDPVHRRRTEERLPDQAMIDAVLRDQFGIDINATATSRSERTSS